MVRAIFVDGADADACPLDNLPPAPYYQILAYLNGASQACPKAAQTHVEALPGGLSPTPDTRLSSLSGKETVTITLSEAGQ